MEKIIRYSNHEALVRKQWYSTKVGFIDLATVNNEHLLKIVEFWKKNRKNMMNKIRSVSIAVAKIPPAAPDRIKIVEKNKRRVEVVNLFDGLIKKELIKRKF